MESLKWEIEKRLSSSAPSIQEVAYLSALCLKEIQIWFLENHNVGIDSVAVKFSTKNSDSETFIVAIGYHSQVDQ